MQRRHLGLIVALGVVLSACGTNTPSPSVSPTSTPQTTPSVEPSPSALPSPSASEEPVIAVNALGVVTTSDLRVRSKPEVSDDSELLTPLLDFGRQVYVVAGPVAASGYDWYQVQPINTPGESEELPFGWIAAADKDGTPWLVSDAPECESAPTTAAAFAEIRPIIGLACYGSEDLTFPARLIQPEATCGVDIGWTIDPDWLAGTCQQPKYLLAQVDNDEFLNVAFDPEIDTAGLEPGVETADWQDVTVTGHFDHDAAQACTGVSNGEPVPLDPAEIVLRCRSTFAITEVEPAGS
jgi:hypothetical protein